MEKFFCDFFNWQKKSRSTFNEARQKVLLYEEEKKPPVFIKNKLEGKKKKLN